MKCVVELTEAENQTLHRLSVNHKHRGVRTRAAGVLLLGRRVKLTEIASKLGVSGQSAYNWAHTWRKQGVCGLLTGHKGGRPRALSEGMLATATEVARTESMTLGQIAKRIEVVYGEPMPCALETLSVALRREGFSFKRNSFSLKKAQSGRL
ncbi:helix-turn-helix domain-containing protein [Caballeronia sordidicola]|uniref:helix-turn-helix domain-containing protein n=1 Tax=Caballeronia sordidicola TaxID=196367 RepID=UPI0004D0144F|nr:helix-turn-helix domain-containing protein [Caballeronia sordidicola]